MVSIPIGTWSNTHNPFEYIRSDNDIIKLVTNMMKNTTPKGASSSDPFRDNALSLYLQAIMSYIPYKTHYIGTATVFAYKFFKVFINAVTFDRVSSLWVHRTQGKLSVQSKGIHANWPL